MENNLDPRFDPKLYTSTFNAWQIVLSEIATNEKKRGKEGIIAAYLLMASAISGLGKDEVIQLWQRMIEAMKIGLGKQIKSLEKEEDLIAALLVLTAQFKNLPI